MFKKLMSLLIVMAIVFNTSSFADQIAQSIVKKANIYDSWGKSVTLHSLTEGQYVTLKSTSIKYINTLPMYQTIQGLYIPISQLKFVYMTPYKTAGYYKLNKDVKLRTQPYSGMNNLTNITLKTNEVISIHDTLYTERGTQWGITKVKNKNYYLYMGNVDKINYTPAPKKKTNVYNPFVATVEAVSELAVEFKDGVVATAEMVGDLVGLAKYNVTHRNILQDNIDLINIIIEQTKQQDWSQYDQLLIDTYSPVVTALKGVGSAVVNELSSDLEVSLESSNPNEIYKAMLKLMVKTVALVHEGAMLADDGIKLLKTAKNSVEADDVMRHRAALTGKDADDFDGVVNQIDDIIDDLEAKKSTTYFDDIDDYSTNNVNEDFIFDDPDVVDFDYENNFSMKISGSDPNQSIIYAKHDGADYTEIMNVIHSGVKFDRSHLSYDGQNTLNLMDNLNASLTGHSRGNYDERSAQRLILDQLSGKNVIDEVRVLPSTYTDAKQVRIIDVLDYNNGIAIEVKTGFLYKSYVQQMYKDGILKDIGGFIKSDKNGLIKDSFIQIKHYQWHVFRNLEGKIGYDIEALSMLKDMGIEVIFHY